jgi:hypothetical protein
VVESTYNWYWLVDGLQAASFVVHLANITAMKKYEYRANPMDALRHQRSSGVAEPPGRQAADVRGSLDPDPWHDGNWKE